MKRVARLFTVTLCTSLLFLLQSGTTRGQAYNEDEWYDPTDWFDGNNYEWEDTLGPDYGYDYGYEPFDSRYEYEDYYNYHGYDNEGYDNYGALDYDYGLGDGDYGYDYSYDTGDDYGYRDNAAEDYWYDDEPGYGAGGGYGYDYNLDTGPGDYTASNFGWHYDWDPTQNRWVRDYGRYDAYYDYYHPQDQYTSPNQNRNRSRNQTQAQSRTQTQGQRQGDSNQRAQRVLRGELAMVRALNLRDRATGQSSRHNVAQLQMEDGRWVLVDLGNNRGLRNQLNEGDRVVVRGQTGRINGRRVLMANQIQINGQNDPVRTTDRQTASPPQIGPTLTYTGRVSDAQPVTFGTTLNRNCFRLQLQNGRNILVDLGSNVSLSDLDLSWNDLVTLQGNWRTLNGRPVFQANRLVVNGEITNIRQTALSR